MGGPAADHQGRESLYRPASHTTPPARGRHRDSQTPRWHPAAMPLTRGVRLRAQFNCASSPYHIARHRPARFPYAPGHLAPPCRSQSGLRWHWAGIGPAPNNQDSPRPGFAAPSSSIERSARPPYPLSSESSCATTTCEARRLPGRLSKRTETIRPSEHAYAGRRQPASAAYATSIPISSVHTRGPTLGVRRALSAWSPSVSSPSMSFMGPHRPTVPGPLAVRDPLPARAVRTPATSRDTAHHVLQSE